MVAVVVVFNCLEIKTQVKRHLIHFSEKQKKLTKLILHKATQPRKLENDLQLKDILVVDCNLT